MIITSKTKPMRNDLSTYDETTYYAKNCNQIRELSPHVLVLSFENSDSIVVVHKNTKSHEHIIEAFMSNESISFDWENYTPNMIYRYEDFTKWIAFSSTARDRKILGEPQRLIDALIEYRKTNK